MRQSTYSKGHISVEGYRTGRNVMSKKEHISDTIESDRRRKLSADKNKNISSNDKKVSPRLVVSKRRTA